MLTSIDNDLSYPMQLINNIASFIVYLMIAYIGINAYIANHRLSLYIAYDITILLTILI